MVSQRCPRCASGRVRRGYRPTPIWSKVLFRYNLLCDNCNWEFTGFAIPGTVSTKPTKRQKKTAPAEQNERVEKKTENIKNIETETPEINVERADRTNAGEVASTVAATKKKRVKIQFKQ